MVLNPESNIVSLNPYGCALLGYDEAELLGKRIDVLLTMATRIYYQTHVYPLITLKNAANELSLTLQTRQRAQIPVLLNVVRYEQDGQLLNYFSFLPVYQRRQYEQDILAAKKTAENELLRNEKLTQTQRELEQHQVELDRQMSRIIQRNDELEQFGKVISHDLQEPLRKIMIFADLLTNSNAHKQAETREMSLAGIGKASARLRQLIGDLQLYFTLSNQLSNTEPVDLMAVLKRVCQEYEPAIVTFDLKTLPTVVGNGVELLSLFRHLLDNAVKFRQLEQPALVSISSTVVGHNSFRVTPDKYNYVDYVRIIISDNGIGFDNRQRGEVFRIMKKLHLHTPGVGLGLAMAKKIVERHNGQISAESAVGKGTKITLLLPVA